MTAMAMAQPSARLPPLREDLTLFPGPPAHDGSPTWTLHDPARNQFFRLGWVDFEILSRWDCGDAFLLVAQVNDETTLEISFEDVKALTGFLLGNHLTRSQGAADMQRLAARLAAARKHWAEWLLHNYLFLRIPLLRPNHMLERLLPLVGWVYSGWFAATVALSAAGGLYLVTRQWEAFKSTFLYHFSLEGMLWYFAALGVVKIFHELGHAFTAKRYGCHIPTMGVALMVLWPVLYTDTNDVWKLQSQRQRLAVGGAGMAAELSLAAFATLAWGFLPDGPVRSAAFLLATTSWLMTLAVNLNPFMRFDGYFLTSDLLEIPNLHHRSFAFARWFLREILFGFGDPPPEEVPRRRRWFLVGFGIGTWIYRFFLFMGVALLVYHFVVKVVGVFLMMVEVGWFIALPVFKEAIDWWKRRKSMKVNLHLAATALALITAVAAVNIPWQTRVIGAAVLKAVDHSALYAPQPGLVAEILVAEGQRVEKGQPLLRLTSPDLDFKVAQTRRRMDIESWELSSQGMEATFLARSQVTQQELAANLTAYEGFQRERDRMTITAPFAGRVVDLAEDVMPGQWVGQKERLMSVIVHETALIEAYVDEEGLGRISVGAEAYFHPENPDLATVPCRVTSIDRADSRTLPQPYLASKYGGQIPVREAKRDALVPDHPVYRVLLTPDGAVPPVERILRGQVAITGEAESLAARTWRAILAVMMREAGA